MKKVWFYLKMYKKESFLAPLFKMLEAIFELFVPLVMSSMIDKGIYGNQPRYLVSMCGVLIGLGVVGLVCSIVAQYFAAKAAVGVATNIRRDLFSHLLGLSYTEVDTLGTSTMITRMTSDVNQTQTGVNMTLRLLLRSPFVVFGALIMAMFIDVKMSLIFVVVIVLLSVVVGGIMSISIPRMKKVQQKLDQVLGKTRENLTGVRVIRAFCKEDKEVEEFGKSNNILTTAQKKAGNIQALLNPITYIIINLGIILLIWKGAVQVNIGILSQGQVVALYNYMSQILVELIKLATLIITINKSIASANRVQEVFTIKSSMKDVTNKNLYETEHKETMGVVFEDVSLTYKDAKEPSLSHIEFQVKKGQTVGIIGGTGAGKSSLIHLIPRFYEATKGRVLVDGIPVENYPIDELRSKVGMVPQKATLFKGTIRENLKWGNEHASDSEIMEGVTLAQGLDVVNGKGGLDGKIEQNGRNLSGGQRQRLTIARALVRKPEILILDDSASALDLATDAKLRNSLRMLDYHPTIFIVSQRTASIAQADLILVLEDGNLVGKGTHEELLVSCQVYQEIYKASSGKEEGTKNKNHVDRQKGANHE